MKSAPMDTEKVAQLVSFVIAYTQTETEAKATQLRTSLLEEVSAELKKLQEAVEKDHTDTIKSLYETMAFKGDVSRTAYDVKSTIQTELGSATTSLRSLIENTRLSIDQQLAESVASLSRNASAVDSKLSGGLATLNEDVGLLRDSTHAGDVATEVLVLEETANLEAKIHATETNLLEQVDLANKGIESTAGRLTEQLESTSGKITEQIESLTKSLNARDDALNEALMVAGKDLRLETQELQKNVFEKIKSAVDRFKKDHTALKETLTQRVSNLVKDVAGLTKSVDKLEATDKTLDTKIDNEVSVIVAQTKAIEVKVDKLHLDQLSFPKAVQELRKFVDDLFATIKIPAPITVAGEAGKPGKDGHDAHEWIFQIHPRHKNIFMFRREDWDYWKMMNLVPPPPKVAMPRPGGGMVMHGVGGGTSGSINTAYYDSNGQLHTNGRLYIIELTTDSTGAFAFDLSTINSFVELIDYKIDSEMLTDLSLNIKERFTKPVVSEVVGTIISGYVFRQLTIFSAPGTQSYAMVEAPAGVVVRLQLLVV